MEPALRCARCPWTRSTTPAPMPTAYRCSRPRWISGTASTASRRGRAKRWMRTSTPLTCAWPARWPMRRPPPNYASTGTNASPGHCAVAPFRPGGSSPTLARRRTNRPPARSTAPSRAPSKTRWTASCRRSTKPGSPSRPAAASAMSSAHCDRAGRSSPAPARTPPGRCPSWISSTRCVSPCPRPAVVAVRRWARSMCRIRTCASSSAPSARTVGCASSTCRC